MPIPNLSHPVPIIIRQLDKATTLYDDDYREPIQQSRRLAAVTIPGQVSWGNDKRLVETRGGVELTSTGYVVFRYVDLNGMGITLQLDDRITSMGGVTCDLYIVSFRPMGHYPDVGGPTLLKALFDDRQPMRQGLG